MGADVEKARSWYRKAESFGSPEASRRLNALAESLVRASRQAIEAGADIRRGACHVSFRRQVAFAHHHDLIGALTVGPGAGAGSRPGQVRRAAVRGQLRGLPSQPARPRQGQVQLDAVVLPAAALHEQRRLGAGAHRLSAVGRCPSRQAAACRPQVAAAQRRADRKRRYVRRLWCRRVRQFIAAPPGIRTVGRDVLLYEATHSAA